MAASGPIGVLGFSEEFAGGVINLSQIEGNLSSKSFHNKICNVMGCPPVYGAPLITLMASFPEVVRRTQKKEAEEEAKKANYVLDKITKIKGFKLRGKYPKIHPLTNIITEGFSEVAKNHPRKGFLDREEVPCKLLIVVSFLLKTFLSSHSFYQKVGILSINLQFFVF